MQVNALRCRPLAMFGLHLARSFVAHRTPDVSNLLLKLLSYSPAPPAPLAPTAVRPQYPFKTQLPAPTLVTALMHRAGHLVNITDRQKHSDSTIFPQKN